MEKSEYHISSSGNDSVECLRPGQPLLPCASLSYLMRNVHRCAIMGLLDNITLRNTIITFNSSWQHITLVGTSSLKQAVAIVCEGNSGIRIDSTSHFNLDGLYFIGCVFTIADDEVSPYPHGRFIGASIFVKASTDIVIHNCFFLNASWHSIMLADVYGNVNISHCHFVSSKLFIDSVNTYTGGIVIRQNSFSNDSWITVFSCRFTSNFALNINCKTCNDFFENKMDQQYGACINIIRWANANNLRNFSISIDHNLFIGNEATNGGAISAYFYNYGNLKISNSHFINNKAVCEGGALFFVFSDYKLGNAEDQYHSKLYIVHSHFIDNKAYSGGALTVTAGILCDSDCYRDNVYIDDSLFRGNSASGPGFAVSLKGPEVRNTNGQDRFYLAVHFINSKFENNWGSNSSYGALSAKNALLDFVRGSTTVLHNTTGGAMTLLNTHAVFGCNLTFCGNSGTLGGAVYLDGNSDIELKSWSNVRFINNTASVQGGAVYSQVSSRCTFNFSSTDLPSVTFKKNSAGLLNQSIYIESIGICSERYKLLLSLFTYSSSANTEVLFPLHNLTLQLEPDTRRYMLGEIFHVILLNISDIFDHETVGIGYLNLFTDKYILNKEYQIKGPSTIGLDNYTKEIDFFIHGLDLTDNVNLTINLFFERHEPYGVGKVDIDIVLVPCKLGYRYEDGICICEDGLVGEVVCIPHTQDLCIRRHYWFSTELKRTFPCPALNCLFVNHDCPGHTGNCTGFDDYCSIESSDDICQNGRSGFLCSQCASGYSFSFAAFKCSPTSTCSIGRFLVLVLALVVYWVLLILAITMCLMFKLSVRSGFMYGIVYFFSVAALYTKNSEMFAYVWLQIFMYLGAAITLLDPELLGYINFCFVKIWTNPLPHELFRFATPIFVLSAMCTLIFLSRHCRMPKCLSFSETSPIHVICLLILLSYTSISYTSLKLLIPMKVNGSLVVQVAPTVAYLHSEHIPYVIIAVLAELFFALPLCFLFLFAPLISRRVNLVKLRLKPIVDEFQACYKSRYRWYAGFYFLARQIIYLVHGIILEPSPHLNNVLTSINILVLLLHITIQPYSKKWLNILDTILLIDIVVISMYSPEKVMMSDASTTKFFNSTLIPNILVLLPTMLVFAALILITFNRIITALGIGNPISVYFKILKKHSEEERYLENVSTEHYEEFREPLLGELNSSLSQNASQWEKTSKSYGTLSF